LLLPPIMRDRRRKYREIDLQPEVQVVLRLCCPDDVAAPSEGGF
jgi:hypothetical protein